MPKARPALTQLGDRTAPRVGGRRWPAGLGGLTSDTPSGVGPGPEMPRRAGSLCVKEEMQL